MDHRPIGDDTLSGALTIARDLVRRARIAVQQTPGMLLLSLLLGVALWVFVTDAENPQRVDVFPAFISVEAANVGSSLAVANTLASVQVRVATTADRWDRLTSGNFRAFVDLNGLRGRDQQVPVHVDVTGISGVRVVETVPSSITVNLEDFARKNVAVTTRLVGAVPLGYQLSAAQPERDTVQVSGPQSLVGLVTGAVADFNVTGLTTSVQQAVSLAPRGEGGGEIRGVELNPPSLRVAVTVEQISLSRTLPLEARITGQPAAGYRITAVDVSPPAVSVRGPIEVLQGLETLSLTPVDVTGATTGRLTKEATLQPVPGVRSTTTVNATVAITIEPLDGTLRLTVAPTITGVGGGLRARTDLTTVTVVLRGPLPRLNTLTPDQVQAIADAAGLGGGTHVVAIRGTAPAGIVVVSVQPQTASVTLEPAP